MKGLIMLHYIYTIKKDNNRLLIYTSKTSKSSYAMQYFKSNGVKTGIIKCYTCNSKKLQLEYFNRIANIAKIQGLEVTAITRVKNRFSNATEEEMLKENVALFCNELPESELIDCGVTKGSFIDYMFHDVNTKWLDNNKVYMFFKEENRLDDIYLPEFIEIMWAGDDMYPEDIKEDKEKYKSVKIKEETHAKLKSLSDETQVSLINTIDNLAKEKIDPNRTNVKIRKEDHLVLKQLSHDTNRTIMSIISELLNNKEKTEELSHIGKTPKGSQNTTVKIRKETYAKLKVMAKSSNTTMIEVAEKAINDEYAFLDEEGFFYKHHDFEKESLQCSWEWMQDRIKLLTKYMTENIEDMKFVQECNKEINILLERMEL
jgi:hypothetical protein